MKSKDKNITFQIIKHLGIIETHTTGWTMEMNLVSWNGNPPKYDIRDWDPKHERMSKGITLQEHQLRSIAKIWYENQ